MNKDGIRRGPPPEEELEWLRAHRHCKSIRDLFREYSEQFGHPYKAVASFHTMLKKYSIYPITVGGDTALLDRMLEMVEIHGAVHWTYHQRHLYYDSPLSPHWLWRWHKKGLKTGSGARFAPPPISIKEKQFERNNGNMDPD